jgi:hypothetical protein
MPEQHTKSPHVEVVPLPLPPTGTLGGTRHVRDEGLHVKCRPVDPRRWWRPDGIVGWVDELTYGGARLRLNPVPEAKPGSRWTVRVGRLEGEVEIVRVSSLGAVLHGITVDVRFIELRPDLHELIDAYLTGRQSADDWKQLTRGAP